jgi:ribonucleoside-diphosphate reductase alpha chain
MYVIKRDGRREAVKFDKITARVKKLCYGLDPIVDATQVTLKVIDGIFDGVTTTELDNLTAEVAATMTVRHPDYAQLASRIAVSNLHKNTKKSFSETMKDLYKYIDPKTGEHAALLADDVHEIIQENAETAGQRHHLRPRLPVRFLRLQNAGAQLPAAAATARWWSARSTC